MATPNALVLKKDLVAALTALAPAVPKKTALPILSHVRIEGTQGGSKLRISGTNLEIIVRRELPAQVMTELDACYDFALIKTLVDTGPDVIELTPTAIAGATVTTMSPDQFPVVPGDRLGEATTVDAAAFVGMLTRVAPSAAKDESRPILCAVSLTTTHDGKTLEAVACDGYRLAKDSIWWDGPKLAVLPPARIAAALAKQKLAGAIEIRLAENQAQLWISGPGVIFITRLIEGTFPDYRQIIPRDLDARSTLAADALAAALKGLIPIAKRDNDIVRLALNGVLSISAQNDNGEARAVTVPTWDQHGPDVTFALNATYLLNVCQVAKGRQLEIGKASAVKHGPIRLDDGRVESVVMPMASSVD